MTTLENLYYGNISPHERYVKHGTRENTLVRLICRNEEELNASFTEKQKEVFERFKDCQSELCGITKLGAFREGFILAVRIVIKATRGLEVAGEM